MFGYLIRRLLLVIPTFLGITLVSFLIINLAPGGPVEQKMQALRFGGSAAAEGGGGAVGGRQRDNIVNEEVVEALKKQYGFDKPLHMRYLLWLKNVVMFDFGDSFVYEEPVTSVILSKMPVSLQFGLTSLFLTYLVCIPLGVRKAVVAGSKFDHITSFILYVAYSIPPLVLGLFLIVFFAGANYFSWFPLGGIRSDDFESMTKLGQIWDRVHHAILPLICYMITQFTFLTMLMRNSLLEIVKLDYIRTARAKGLDEKIVMFKHALRNALIPVVADLGGVFNIIFAGSYIVEMLFSLDGMGLLTLNSAYNRDIPVLMGMTAISSMLFLVGRLVSDFIYVIVDPRIDFK